jgi:geranylgeranyl pyrophosphate synthase
MNTITAAPPAARKEIVELELIRMMDELALRESILYDCVRWSVLNGGARVRPMFFLDISSALGHYSPALVQAACSIELLHCSSLILDDLPYMDNATLRRNRPANHIVFSVPMAMLAATYLQFFGVEQLTMATHQLMEAGIISPDADQKILSCLKSSVEDAVTGQWMDLNKTATGQEEILQAYARKTGAIFKVLGETVSILTNGSDLQRNWLGNLGENYGIAFQLRDDLVDAGTVITDNKKDKGLDKDKNSFANLFGEQKTRECFADYYERVWEDIDSLGVEREHFARSIRLIQLDI